jgi:hypothetical protein
MMDHNVNHRVDSSAQNVSTVLAADFRPSTTTAAFISIHIIFIPTTKTPQLRRHFVALRTTIETSHEMNQSTSIK